MGSTRAGRNLREKLLWLILPVLGWEVAGRILAFSTHLLPTPSRIILEIYREAPRLVDHALSTLSVFSAGLLVALALGIPTGMAWAAYGLAGSALLRRMKTAQAAPVIALAPLLWIWFQFGTSSKIALTTLTALPPIVRGAFKSYESVPDELLDLARLAGSPTGIVFLKLRWPCGFPSILECLLSAAPLAMAGTIAAEFVQTDKGLGYLMVASSFTADIPVLFSALALVGAISLAFHTGIRLIERLATPPSSEAERRQRPPRQPGR